MEKVRDFVKVMSFEFSRLPSYWQLAVFAVSFPTLAFLGSWIYLGIPIVFASPLAIATFTFGLSVKLILFSAISHVLTWVIFFRGTRRTY